MAGFVDLLVGFNKFNFSKYVHFFFIRVISRPHTSTMVRVLSWSLALLIPFHAISETREVSLLKLVKATPEHPKWNAELGNLYLRKKEYEKAIEHLRVASASEPSPSNLSQLAQAYRGAGRKLDVVRTLEILVVRLKSAPILEQLGQAYTEISNYDKATEQFRKAILLDPKRLTAYESLYEVFTKTNNNYERRSLLNDIQNQFGESAEVSSKLCRFYSQDNYFEKGVQVCQNAIILSPKTPDNHVFLALNYKSTGEVEQSLKIIHSAAKRFPKSEFTLYSAGIVNEEIKNFESAKHYFKKCTAADPKSDRCWVKFATTALELKDYKGALNGFESACKINGRAHYSAFRNAVTKVRIDRQVEWEDKFQAAVEKCGVQ